MRLLAPISALLAVALAVLPAASAGDLTIPTAGETPFTGAANDDTDTLFDCYRQHLLDDPHLQPGPPLISMTASGLVLRADYTNSYGHGRLACTTQEAAMENIGELPPLARAGDAATARAFEDWKSRRVASEARRLALGRRPPPDPAMIRYLEGIWQDSADQGDTACLAYTGYHTQYEFEFAKSGGRLLVFEPTDLFTPLQIAGISRDDDRLTIQFAARDGSLHDGLRIRMLDARHFEFIPAPGTFPKRASTTATRCGEPDHAPTAGVSPERMAALAPPLSGGQAYPAVIDGIADDAVCRGEGLSDRQRFDQATIQFELYGPVHRWIFAPNVRLGDHHMAIFDYVRAVKAIDSHTLKLTLQEHLEKGGGWDVPASRGETYEITVIDRGTRIEIPEFHKTFIRCDPSQSIGLHRWG